jgi:hypothetical protein
MMLAGGLAGTATWLTVYPLDIVKSRVQIDVTGILSLRCVCVYGVWENGFSIYIYIYIRARDA